MRLNLRQILSYLPAAIRELDYSISPYIEVIDISNFHLTPLQHQWVLAVSQNQLNHRQLSPYANTTIGLMITPPLQVVITSAWEWLVFPCSKLMILPNTCLEFPIHFLQPATEVLSQLALIHDIIMQVGWPAVTANIINFQCGSFFHCFYICWGRSVCENCGNLHTSKISLYTVQDVSKDVYFRYDTYL